jgi:hypothetical protein
MWLRRIVAWLLLLAPVQASASSILANDGHAHGGCTDHVCACVKACPLPKAKKPKAGGCHGDEAPAGPLMKAAGCGHRQEAVPPALARPHVIPAVMSTAPVLDTERLAPPDDVGLRAGFLEIDLPPPRPLS